MAIGNMFSSKLRRQELFAKKKQIAESRPKGRSEPSDFSVGVHGARGLFAFLVLVYHVANSGLPTFGEPAIVAGFLSSLKFGVELFFAISGFVIAGTLERAKTPGLFLVNRASRIFPVLWCAVFVVVAMSLISGREAPATYPPTELVVVVFENLLALPGLFPVQLFVPPAWTLSYELGFYVLCFIYLVALRRWNISLLVPLLLAGIAFACFHPRALFFLSGIIVASGKLTDTRIAWTARAPSIWFFVFLFAWSMASLSKPPFFTTVFDLLNGPRILFAVIAFIAATLMLEGIVRGHGVLTRLLRSAPMIWLGTISYSLYLWHPVVMGVIKPAMRSLGLVALAGPWSQIVFFVLVVPPAFLVAHVSQVVLEKHATEWLRRPFKQRHRTVSAIASA